MAIKIYFVFMFNLLKQKLKGNFDKIKNINFLFK